MTYIVDAYHVCVIVIYTSKLQYISRTCSTIVSQFHRWHILATTQELNIRSGKSSRVVGIYDLTYIVDAYHVCVIDIYTSKLQYISRTCSTIVSQFHRWHILATTQELNIRSGKSSRVVGIFDLTYIVDAYHSCIIVIYNLQYIDLSCMCSTKV